MIQKLLDLKEVVCCIYRLKEKEKMGFCVTLKDTENIPKLLVKGKVKK